MSGVHCSRYNVRDLLQLDFFLEETGIKVDLVNTTRESEQAVIQLQLRVLDAKKRKPQHKENEAIQFDYHIDRDNPEDVSQEMVRSGYANEEDLKIIIRQIRERVAQYRRDQDRKLESTAAPAKPAEGEAAAATTTQPPPAPVTTQQPVAQTNTQPKPQPAVCSLVQC